MQYLVENLMISKAVSVHTSKTKTSYRQDTQRVGRERFYCWGVFGGRSGGGLSLGFFSLWWKTEVNSVI